MSPPEPDLDRHRTPQAPRRPLPGGAAVALGVAVGVAAVSTASVLVRLADAPALALAFWRCAGGALALAPAAVRARRRTDAPPLHGRLRGQLVASGLLLALHFALFIGSLSLTTVASSVVLVTMSPLFVALGSTVLLREAPGGRTWAGLALAAVGALVVGAGDLAGGLGPGLELGRDALVGDGMAAGGAVAVAGYLLLGRSARRTLPVSTYASAVYAVAAAALLVACLVSGTALGGFTAGTWWAIAGLVAGPQLLGHTVFNTLLVALSATAVAVATLAEPLGATVLAWLVLGEVPSAALAVGAPLVLGGVWLATTTGRPSAPPVA